MKTFFKQVFSNLVALFIFCILSVIGVISLFSFFIPAEVTTTIKPNTFLEIELSGSVVPYSTNKTSLKKLFTKSAPEFSLITLENVLKKAAEDDNITGILIKPEGLSCSHADLEAILDLLNSFTETSNKPLVCYTENARTLQATIGAISTHHLNASYGYYKLNGAMMQSIFYKDLFEAHGIKPYIFRSGEYKGAGDPYLFNKYPQKSKKRFKKMLAEQEIYLKQPTIKGLQKKNSNIGTEEWETLLDTLQDQLSSLTATQALEKKLIDGTVSSFENAIDWITNKYQCNFIHYNEYSTTLTATDSASRKMPKAYVIHLKGTIMPGQSKKGEIGHKTIIQKLDALPPTCDTVFFILDTPGGSVFATEAIVAKMNELKATKNIRFVGIMQGVCGSGGLYISGACDEVLAYKSTLTGSLGVISVILNIRELLERYSIHIDSISNHTSSLRSFYAFLAEDLTQAEIDELQQDLMDTEHRFKQTMTRNGKISLEKVSQYAEGKVFLGTTGLEAGFVDEIIETSLLETLQQKAPEHQFVFLSPYEEEFKLSDMLGNSFHSELINTLSLLSSDDMLVRKEALASLKKYEGIQMRLDFEILLEDDNTL